MDGFERKKEQSQKAIIEAAMELFKVHGFKKASINEIAAAAGVSPVTIYNHFGSKDGLVRETVKVLMRRIMDRAWEIIRSDMPFPEKLETIVFDKAKIASEYRGEVMREASRNDPQLMTWLEAFWKEDVNRATLELLEEGKREGFINPGLPMELMVKYLEIIRRGVYASPELVAEIKPELEVYRQLNYLFIYGLVGKRD
ncbi:MAG: TetR/AcrR family transcriptional regulator [Dehalococcoidia bacterium]|jgi:AcrR family transcriptional regulator